MRPIVLLIAVLCLFLVVATALAAPCCPGGNCGSQALPMFNVWAQPGVPGGYGGSPA